MNKAELLATTINQEFSTLTQRGEIIPKLRKGCGHALRVGPPLDRLDLIGLLDGNAHLGQLGGHGLQAVRLFVPPAAPAIYYFKDFPPAVDENPMCRNIKQLFHD